MKMRRESGAVKSNKVNHNGPGIIGLRQPQSSTTPNTSHRSEFSTLTQNRNGNVYTPTRGTNNYKTHSDAIPLTHVLSALPTKHFEIFRLAHFKNVLHNKNEF